MGTQCRAIIITHHIIIIIWDALYYYKYSLL